MAHQNGVSHAPMPALPKLPLQRQDMAVLMVVETLAEADSPAAVGERLLQSLQVLIADAAGGVLLQAGHGTATPLAAVGTAPALAARLAEALPARASALHCLSLDELDIDSSLRKALEAEGCRALLLLPLTVAGSCAGVALMLLPKAYRLAPTQKRVLTTAAAVAAQALTAALRQQALAARPTPGPAMPRRREPSGRTVDAVTGLTSGHQFRALLDMEVERARRYHESLSLLLIDIDAPSTTATATPRATARWPGWGKSCARNYARWTTPAATAARSSRCCCRAAAPALSKGWPSACAGGSPRKSSPLPGSGRR